MALLALVAGLGCAQSKPPARTVLEGEGPGQVDLPDPSRESLEPHGAISIPFRGPDVEGNAYRLILEVSGERWSGHPSEEDPGEPLGESHLLELEYTERGVDGREDAYLLVLDALHYKLLQQNPKALREIELGDDRFRMFSNGKEVFDMRGAQPKEDLTPRDLLLKMFASVLHDPLGNPIKVTPLGVPAARRFVTALPMRTAIGYSRLPQPPEPIEPGAVWRAERFPVSAAGEVGLALTIEYLLAGFESVDGVQCAWIVLRAEKTGENVPSEAGFEFDRVEAKVEGSAWVALETGRLQRFELADEIRAGYTRGDGEASIVTRTRHATRLVLTRRDAAEIPKEWADGSERFGRR